MNTSIVKQKLTIQTEIPKGGRGNSVKKKRLISETVTPKSNLSQLNEEQVTLSYPQNALISFSISVESSRLWDAPYSEYQEYLFSRGKKI